MTFRDYCSLIANSVVETGYAAFRPSACVPDDTQDEFHVLDGGLSEDGQESVAFAWADSLPKKSGMVFLAYRGGDRKVLVVELKDGAFVHGIVIKVNPYAEASG